MEQVSTDQVGSTVASFPVMAAAKGRFEQCPRRIRAWLGGELVVDTTSAAYGWEFPYYPQYYVPVRDVVAGVLVDEGREVPTPFGPARRHSVRVGSHVVSGAARVYDAGSATPVAGRVRFDWAALDAWFEEDEEVFVHPRNPYVRVDALRSRRMIRVEHDGEVLAETTSPVMVFETGLPARSYVPRTDVVWEHLVASQTRSECPYKGTTSDYWSRGDLADVAWSYQFPTPTLSAISGLVSFYDEKLDVFVDGHLQSRPRTRHA